MKLKTLLLPFAVLALCANAFAATPSDESLERFVSSTEGRFNILIKFFKILKK